MIPRHVVDVASAAPLWAWTRQIVPRGTTTADIERLSPACRAIRRGSFGSVKDLIARIDLFAANWNAGASPFAWVKTAEEILANVVRKRSANLMIRVLAAALLVALAACSIVPRPLTGRDTRDLAVIHE